MQPVNRLSRLMGMTRLACQVEAIRHLINMHFIDNYDFCRLGTVASDFACTEVTQSKAALLRVLDGIASRGPGGSTQLLDSIAKMTALLVKKAHPDYPQVLIVGTDGIDECSTEYDPKNPLSPAKLGQDIHRAFTHKPGNFAYILGMGSRADVNMKALETIGDFGGFRDGVINTNFEKLDQEIQAIAHKLTASLVEKVTVYGDFAVRERGIIQSVGRVPIQLAILLDVSGSMSKPVVNSVNNSGVW